MTKHILRTLALTAAAFAMSLAMSAPAQADTASEEVSTAVVSSCEGSGDVQPMSTAQCHNYIKDKGYAVGPLVRGACNKGVSDYNACYTHFTTKTDVWPSHARSACSLAGIV